MSPVTPLHHAAGGTGGEPKTNTTMTEYKTHILDAAAKIFAELTSNLTDPYQLRTRAEESLARAHLLAATAKVRMHADDRRDILDAAARMFLHFYRADFTLEYANSPNRFIVVTAPKAAGEHEHLMVANIHADDVFAEAEELSHYLRRLKKLPYDVRVAIDKALIAADNSGKGTDPMTALTRRLKFLLAEDRINELYAELNLNPAARTLRPDSVAGRGISPGDMTSPNAFANDGSRAKAVSGCVAIGYGVEHGTSPAYKCRLEMGAGYGDYAAIDGWRISGQYTTKAVQMTLQQSDTAPTDNLMAYDNVDGTLPRGMYTLQLAADGNSAKLFVNAGGTIKSATLALS